MAIRRLALLASVVMLAALVSCDTPTETRSGTASLFGRVLVDAGQEACFDLIAGRTMDAGDVCIRVVEDALVVEYATHDGWTLAEAHAWLGQSVADMPLTNGGNPIPGQFPYTSGWLDGATTWSFTVPVAGLGIEDPSACEPATWYLAAHAALEHVDPATGEVTGETGWSAGERIARRGNWGTYSYFTVTCEQDECTHTLLYATENNHPAVGATQMPARIWEIDATDAVATLVSAVPAPVNGAAYGGGAITDNFNGNAWDIESGRFYFSDFQRMGADNPLPSPLYYNDIAAGTQQYAGLLVGSPTGGDFHAGVYYYVDERTDDLRAVTFLPNGTVYSDTHVADVLGNTATLAFGDIAITPDGVAYFSATRIPGYQVVFGTFALDGSAYQIIATGSLYGAGGTQIALGSDGVLYGGNARTPYSLFSIDKVTGQTTFIADMAVPFSDLATGPCAF